ncbi:MAG: arginine--tRNA ligase, partial [Clostridia bacterium]|nr:arginine--tRNA ligase [Clostridia bacterium]
MDMKQIIAGRIADAAAASFENCALTAQDVAAMLEIPPEKKMGDYALPCFRLAKTLRKAPPMIAAALAEKCACEEIERVE